MAEDPKAAVPIEAIGRLCVTNGPSWSKDGKTFYHVDSF